MPATIQPHSAACCELPPFLGSTYKPSGKIQKLPESDLEYYTAGPEKASMAIICVYDIFGIIDGIENSMD